MKALLAVPLAAFLTVGLCSCKGSDSSSSPSPSVVYAEQSVVPAHEGFHSEGEHMVAHDSESVVAGARGVKVTITQPKQSATFTFDTPTSSQFSECTYRFVGQIFVCTRSGDQNLVYNLNLTDNSLAAVVDHEGKNISEQLKADGSWDQAQADMVATKEAIDSYMHDHFHMDIKEAILNPPA